jgi:pyruvate,water dikinase
VVNAREAFPGVVTPLTYTFYFPGAEAASGRFWQDLGLLERTAPLVPTDPDQRFFGVFHGRTAINVDRYGEMADRTPGTSAAALEEQMFGVARTGVGRSGTRRRYPHVALRAPATVHRARRDTVRDVPLIKAWRRDWLTKLETADPELARRALRDARARLERVLYRHIMLTAVTQGAYEAVGRLAAAAGHPGAEVEMVVSRTGTDEAHMVESLRSVAAGHTGMDAFLADYGYHGPNEGHLDGRVWRQDPAPLHALMDRYRRAADRAGGSSERAAGRQRTTDAVLAALPAWRRGPARTLLRVAAAMPVLREQGKAQFLQVVDVGRAAATALGDDLAGRGRLDTAHDVFFLTADELLDDRVDRAAVAHRRAEHRDFLTFELPTTWTGEPVVIPHATSVPDEPGPGRAGAGTVLTGLGVSSGTARGRVRVVTDPEADGFDVDDVLVCEITDPSWASIMAIAAAIVIDVGGPISHGAIVARELGIPCVVATGDGTRRLRDGDQVIVDGQAGTVTVTTSA